MNSKEQFCEAVEIILFDDLNPAMGNGVRRLLMWYEQEYNVALDVKHLDLFQLQENWDDIKKRILSA